MPSIKLHGISRMQGRSITRKIKSRKELFNSQRRISSSFRFEIMKLKIAIKFTIIFLGVTARGSYSVIRRASERKTGKEVAIKTVSRDQIDKAGIRREIIVLQRLNSDRLVKILKSYHTGKIQDFNS